MTRLKAFFEDGGPLHVSSGLSRPRLKSLVSLMKARRSQQEDKENR